MSSSFQNEMRVTKRNGELETVEFDKILKRVKTIGKENGLNINYTALVMKVIDQLYDKITTTKLDELSAEQCASMSSIHTDYNILAGHIIISNHQKNTSNSFGEVIDKLFHYVNNKNMSSPLVSRNLYEITQKYGKEIDDICDYSRDYLIDYFGFKTLEKSYLIRMDGKSVERPQHMWLRVAIGIHGDNMERIRETYYYLSNKYFTHATPTLFNAGTNSPQLSSCFLYSMESDSIEGIYNSLKDCALISKWAGGIGLHIHNIRASGSHIRGTNGTSNGIVPMLRVFNNTAKYVDQCLDPDTVVFTKNGPMEIKKIVVGDRVVSEDGNFYRIRKILDNQYQGDMFLLKTQNSIFPLKATDMHPLFTLKAVGKNDTNFSDIKNQLKIHLIAPEFVEIKNINPNDFIGFSSPRYEKDILEYNENDCRMYGILLGSTNEIFNNTDNKMEVCLNFDEKTSEKTIQFVQNYLNEIFLPYELTNSHKLQWKRTNNFKFTNEMVYDENHKKHILQQILHLPKRKLLQFVLGFLETKYSLEDNNGIILKPINSKNMVYGLVYIFMRLNMLIEGNYSNDSFQLIIPKTETICHLLNKNIFENNSSLSSENLSFFEYDGILYTKVFENILLQNTNERVIDIEIDNEEHHNFLTENGIVHNGGGKRNGSIAIYLENWHADIELFLEMRKNHGDEELKARDLFYALWISDLFMERVKNNTHWSLMCPDECPGLSDVYGDDFVKLYTKYETEGRARVKINARDLWFKILDAQMETGTPYILYKDAVNRKSNQKNVGIIKSSNLCVAPETQILTDKGYVKIKSAAGKKTNVWNGKEFSEVEIFKTGDNEELVEVYTSDGCMLECTKYHKFYIQKENKIDTVEAQNLKIGDRLQQCDFPVLNENDELIEKMNWLSNYCDKEGILLNFETKRELQIFGTDRDDLIKIKFLLQTCGINSFLHKTVYLYDYLLIYSGDLNKLLKMGFNPKKIKIDKNSETTSSNNPNEFVRITEVKYNKRYDETYCFTESKRNSGIFNGILTSQCTEITEYSDKDETAVCNLASIALPSYLNMSCSPPVFDYEKLHEVTKIVTYNLNRIIDVNFYPILKAKTSNLRHRPIGIGVQGLADVFMILDIAFDSPEAVAINKKIFETIYHASLERSNELAEKEGFYETFPGSPTSQGILQFDLWGVDPTNERYDWDMLKEKIKKNGLRNSLLVAPMPTASTSQILGFNECIEPITSNIYSRRTIAGEFILMNKYLMKDLMKLGLWDEKIKNNIIANNGSIQQIDNIPIEIKNKYKTVWEISMRHLIDMAADRGAYICQSQSLNLWLEEPDYSTLTSMHFHSWKKGLKTGIYYLRRRARHKAQQFTIEPEKKINEENHEICEMCSS